MYAGQKLPYVVMKVYRTASVLIAHEQCTSDVYAPYIDILAYASCLSNVFNVQLPYYWRMANVAPAYCQHFDNVYNLYRLPFQAHLQFFMYLRREMMEVALL